MNQKLIIVDYKKWKGYLMDDQIALSTTGETGP